MKQLVRLTLFLTLIISIVQFSFGENPGARPVRCVSSNTVVFSPHISDLLRACQAAGSAFSFLMQVGVTLPDTLTIRILDGFRNASQTTLYLGMYDRRSNEIHILSYAHCEKLFREKCFCGLSLSTELHTSFIIHEIAHAVTVNSLANNSGIVAAAEYIAYTTQFHLMPENLRKQILGHITNDGFGNEVEITSLFHDLNPNVFAVKAYRHFIRPENGITFYKKLFSGQCILDREE